MPTTSTDWKCRVRNVAHKVRPLLLTSYKTPNKGQHWKRKNCKNLPFISDINKANKMKQLGRQTPIMVVSF